MSNNIAENSTVENGGKGEGWRPVVFSRSFTAAGKRWRIEVRRNADGSIAAIEEIVGLGSDYCVLSAGICHLANQLLAQRRCGTSHNMPLRDLLAKDCGDAGIMLQHISELVGGLVGGLDAELDAETGEADG